MRRSARLGTCSLDVLQVRPRNLDGKAILDAVVVVVDVVEIETRRLAADAEQSATARDQRRNHNEPTQRVCV